MDQSEILLKLDDIFRDLFDNDKLTLTPATTAKDIPGWDSFMHINIIVACESTFKVKFKTAEVEGLLNVGHLVEAIDSKLKAK
jgi:acyl carrier protein